MSHLNRCKTRDTYKYKKAIHQKMNGFFAVRTRFELVTSCVTGRHSNQLN